MAEPRCASPDVTALRSAMDRLWWTERDLMTAALQHGEVGRESELIEHLQTGDALPEEQHRLLVEVVNDGLRAVGDPLRI